MSVSTKSTRRRSAARQRASGSACPVRLSLDIDPVHLEPLSRDTTNVQGRQLARWETGGLGMTLQAAGRNAAGSLAGRPWPRWLTAEHPLPWLLPMAAMLLSCGIYPLLYSVWLSFQERSRITRQYEFAGLKQWQAAFADDRVWHSPGGNRTHNVTALAPHLVLGMAVALLRDSGRGGYALGRALMTLPLVVPPAVTGMMFLLM